MLNEILKQPPPLRIIPRDIHKNLKKQHSLSLRNLVASSILIDKSGRTLNITNVKIQIHRNKFIQYLNREVWSRIVVLKKISKLLSLRTECIEQRA